MTILCSGSRSLGNCRIGARRRDPAVQHVPGLQNDPSRKLVGNLIFTSTEQPPRKKGAQSLSLEPLFRGTVRQENLRVSLCCPKTNPHMPLRSASRRVAVYCSRQRNKGSLWVGPLLSCS